jgi:hypothetical protein
MITERDLIDVINQLIDEHMQSGEEWTSTTLAREAIGRIGEGVVTESAMIDLARQVNDARGPWPSLPGTEPRLREGVKGVDRLEHRLSLIELLHEGQEEEEPLEKTVMRMRRMHPGVTEGQVHAVIERYSDWLRERAAAQGAQARELERVMAIVKPVMDEDSSTTIGDAMKEMARRGCQEAQREIDRGVWAR